MNKHPYFALRHIEWKGEKGGKGEMEGYLRITKGGEGMWDEMKDGEVVTTGVSEGNPAEVVREWIREKETFGSDRAEL